LALWGGSKAAHLAPARTAPAPLPPLPPLPLSPADAAAHAGPGRRSNWAVRGRLLAGVCPDGAEGAAALLRLLSFGCFVSLQTEPDPAAREAAARGRRAVEFLHLPVAEGGVAPDAALRELVEVALARLAAGKLVYIHGGGGGGLVAVLLGRLYGLSAEEALAYARALHGAPGEPQGAAAPRSAVQVAQVRRLLARLRPPPKGGAPAGALRVAERAGPAE
jgi:protein-tyrosine phosphatase